MGLQCAEEDIGNPNKKHYTSRNFGTPGRRTRRRKTQQMNFQELWDSCAQNRTSETSKNARLGTMELLCAGQNVGNLTNVLSRFLGLLCAKQNVGDLKKRTFNNFGTSVRRAKRWKSKTKVHIQKL